MLVKLITVTNTEIEQINKCVYCCTYLCYSALFEIFLKPVYHLELIVNKQELYVVS